MASQTLKAGLGLALAVLVSVACQTGSGGDTRGDFGSEATPSDPGLGDRGGSTGGSTPATRAGLQTIYFDFDDHTLRPEAREILGA